MTEEREIEKGKKVIDVFTLHHVYNEKGEIVDSQPFIFKFHESQGTQKLFEIAGPLFDSLKSGRLLIIDELDAKMHPLISQHVIKLFSNEKTNPHHAQVLFTTHDTNLLSSHLLRRDQIWFTELKIDDRSTELYSLAEIRNIRKDDNFGKGYISGRYGAIPMLNIDFANIVSRM